MSMHDGYEVILGAAVLYLTMLAVVEWLDPHDWDHDHDGTYY